MLYPSAASKTFYSFHFFFLHLPCTVFCTLLHPNKCWQHSIYFPHLSLCPSNAVQPACLQTHKGLICLVICFWVMECCSIVLVTWFSPLMRNPLSLTRGSFPSENTHGIRRSENFFFLSLALLLREVLDRSHYLLRLLLFLPLKGEHAAAASL